MAINKEKDGKEKMKSNKGLEDKEIQSIDRKLKDAEKFEFEFPIVPLIVGGVLLIAFVFAFFAWDDIKITAGVIFGSEVAEYKKECKNSCELQDKETYCCDPKGIYVNEKNEVYTCQDDILETNCKLNCRNVCFNLCKDITQMIPCAQVGCTWVSKDYFDYGGGYCRAKDGT